MKTQLVSISFLITYALDDVSQEAFIKPTTIVLSFDLSQ